MKQLSFAEVLETSQPSASCVSIYLPPRERLPNSREGAVQLNSVLREVRALSAKSEEFQPEKVLTPLQSNLNRIQSLRENHGVALFASERMFGYLPVSWDSEPFAVVSDTFHVKPLFKEHQKRRHYFVLAVSAKNVKLFTKTGDGIQLLDLLQDPETEESDNFKETHQENKHKLRKTLTQRAQELLNKHLYQSQQWVVLAGSKPLVQAIRSKLAYPYILGDLIPCNANTITLRELGSLAKDVTDQHFEVLEETVLDDYRYCRKSKKALSNLTEIAQAAIGGRVENLIIAEDHHIWGTLDRESGSLSLNTTQRSSRDDDVLDDVLDDLSEVVYQHRGSVWVFPKEKLGANTVYATLRW